MFDQLKAMKAMAALMGNRDEIKAKFDQLQADLAGKRVEADAGGGAVRVVATAKMEIVSVTLDPAVMAGLTGPGATEGRAMVETMITSAVNEALRKAQDVAKDEMSKAAGGVPGLSALLGG